MQEIYAGKRGKLQKRNGCENCWSNIGGYNLSGVERGVVAVISLIKMRGFVASRANVFIIYKVLEPVFERLCNMPTIITKDLTFPILAFSFAGDDLKILSPRPKVYFHETQYSQGFGKMPVRQKTSPLLIAKIMLVKYIVGLLLLLLCHAALAQELNSVIYDRSACGVIKI